MAVNKAFLEFIVVVVGNSVEWNIQILISFSE